MKRAIFVSSLALCLACHAAELRQRSKTGAFEVTLQTQAREVALRDLHSWTLTIAPATVDAVAFDAWMPAHGHGFATQPSLESGAPGQFVANGVRFHMEGDWVLRVRFHVMGSGSWDTAEIPWRVEFAPAVLKSLWIGSHKGPRPDPTNRFADLPAAAALGKRLFEDVRLSGSGAVSCATCHIAATAFADAKRVSAPGLTRNTQGLLGVADATWLFWDGRRDSLWSQALAPIEAKLEMNGSRAAAVRLLREAYRREYEALAGPMPNDEDAVFANLGKFIAAYERTLWPKPSRFDRYVENAKANPLTADEVAGLKIFLKPESQCLNCHNGPMFTNHAFHNIGTAALDGDHPDFGRAIGVQALSFDPFNCRSRFSDDAGACAALDHALAADHDGRLTGAFKTPSLRNVELTAPYMHDGSLATLEDVIEHYRHPPASRLVEIKPLAVTDQEARQLAAFLRTLTGR